jgi:hypothetical protein
MTPVNKKIMEAALLAGRAKLGEQHRRKRQSDRDKLRNDNERLLTALREIRANPSLAWSIAVRALEPKL